MMNLPKKQPRLFPVFVALSLFLASGPLPAAAQMRVQVGAGSGAVVPVVPAISGSILPSAGALSNALTPIGLNGSFAAPSVAPSPLASVVPSALAAVTPQAAATPDGSAIVIPAPGGAAARIAEEAAAYAEVPAGDAPTARTAAPIQKSVAGRILDTLLRRPAAAVSFDGAHEGKGDVGAPVRVPKKLEQALRKIAAYYEKEGVNGVLLSDGELRDLASQLNYIIGLPDSQIPAKLLGHLEGVSIAIRDFLKKRGNPNESAVKAAREAAETLRAKVSAIPSPARSVPIFGRRHFLPLPPVVLSNGTGTDEQPTVPSPDREPTVIFEAYGLPGARDVGGIFETSRKVLSADPADIGAVVNAVKAMIDADSARYGVPSSDLRLIHAQAFEGKGEQADSIFVYFRQTKDGLIVTGSALSFTIKVLDGRPTIVAQTGRVFPQLDVDTGTVLTDEQIMERIAERTGLPVTDAANAFQFFEEKVIYARGSWRHVKLYVAENLPFMVAVDVVAGLVFAWDNRAGLESASAPGVAGEVLGKTVDKGPILANSAISEVPLPFIEVTIGGKSYVTDKDGKLPADVAGEVGPAGLELTATLSGPFVRVENQEGQTLTVQVAVKPGDNRVVFNPGARLEDENALAQVNAFHKVNMSLAFLRDRKLANERMLKTQLPVRTNIGSECNAYYTPGRPSLNFFRSSKNCVNTAYDTVAEHENGHFWDDFTGGIVNGGMSEGWGDILSMFRLNNPIIGEHFLKQARDGVDYIRHGENKYQYNELDEEHDQGQAWGGFAWKLRKALMAALGDAAGAAMAEALVLPTIFAKASAIPEAMAQVLVNATGRDGAILHEAEIRAAARAHGVNLPSAGGKAVAAGLAESLTASTRRWIAAGRQNDAGVFAVTAAYVAARALPASLARPFVKTLIGALGSGDENARTMAGMYLVKLGRKAYGPLLESAGAGWNAASALTVLGSMEDPSLIPQIEPFLRSSDPAVVKAARDAIRNLARADEAMRLIKASQVLGRPLVSERGEEAAILRAHAIGIGPDYTPAEIAEKARILRAAGFSTGKQGEIHKLMKNRIVGSDPYRKKEGPGLLARVFGEKVVDGRGVEYRARYRRAALDDFGRRTALVRDIYDRDGRLVESGRSVPDTEREERIHR